MLDLQHTENRRQIEQAELDLLKTPAERNKLGQFATPPPLATDILTYVKHVWEQNPKPIRFFDPAIGTGSFYSALQRAFPSRSIQAATGIEIDPEFAKTAASLWGNRGLMLTKGDFTKQDPPPKSGRFNLIVANPPYVRHHHVSGADKEHFQKTVLKTLGIKVSGLAGLYCYFLLLSHSWLEENGLAAWLIPSEFMDVNYGDAVRLYLTEKVTLLRIHRFCPSDVQFSDAFVSSAVVVFRNSIPHPGHRVTFSFGGSLSRPHKSAEVPLDVLREDHKWTKYPASVPRAAARGKDIVTFGDLFSIKRGLATGANDFFILTEDAVRENGIPDECVKPILPGPRHLTEAVIEADRDGCPLVTPKLSLIDCNYPEKFIKSSFPSFYSYLERGKEGKIHVGYLASRRSPWYSQEKRDPAPFLCTYMGRTSNGRKPFRFLWNKSIATAHNVYLLMYPRQPLRLLLEQDNHLLEAIFSALQEIDTSHFVGAGRVYGGGLYKMEPSELSLISAEPLLRVIPTLNITRQRSFFK